MFLQDDLVRLCCSCCLIPICPSPLLSVLLLHLPPSSAFSRGTRETRTSRQGMGKWQRSGNAGWGPPADSPGHRGPNTQGLTHLPPAANTAVAPRGRPPHHRHDRWSRPCSVHWIRPTPRPLTLPPRVGTVTLTQRSCTGATWGPSVVFEISFSGWTQGTDELWCDYFKRLLAALYPRANLLALFI